MTETVDTLANKARALHAEGRHGEAISILQTIVARVPDNLLHQHNLAAALGDVGRFREARDILSSAISKGLDRPETLLVYARALMGAEGFDQAEDTYRTLLSRNPDDAIAHRELAQLIWMRTGDAEKAGELIDDTIKKRPGAVGLQVLRAEVKGQMGDADGQFALLKDLLASTGGDPQITYFACRAALACEDFSAALELGARAVAAVRDQDEVVAVYVTALLANGEAKAAETAITPLRARHPTNQYYVALQATAWRLLGDDRYNALFDYDALVFSASLDTPRGWSNLQAYLDDLEAELDNAHKFQEHPFFLSVRHGSQIPSITQSNIPAFRAYAEAVCGPLQEYVDRLQKGDDVLRIRNKGGCKLLSAWSVLLPPNGFHVNHVHPDGWLSSACHIRPPVEDDAEPKAGWLKFGEPGCATAPALEPEYFVKPAAGRMVVFPSYMWHGTMPFHKGPARLTVAVDVGADSASP